MLEELNQSLQLLENSLSQLERKISLKPKEDTSDYDEIKEQIQNFKRSKAKALIIINSLLSKIEELERGF